MKVFLSVIKQYRLHIIAWPLFIFYETLLASLIFGFKVDLKIYIAHYIFIILFFYILSDLIYPWVFKRKLILLILPISLSVSILIYILGHYLVSLSIHYAGLNEKNEALTLNSSLILTNMYRGIYFIGLASGYFLIKRFIYEKKKSAELEKQHLEDIIQKQKVDQALTLAQNAFLKSQINPHFLFNTLDFVYHEVNASSPKAGETIISLSNMMRYALDAEQQGEQVRLMDEINQLEDLIRIYRLRNEQLQLELVYDQEVTHLRIIPLVLLTLAENMFKHGRLNQSDKSARIQIELIDDQLQISTRNLVGRSGGSSHQQGLENIRKRLEQAYGSDSCLTYGVSNGMFELRLSIAVERMR